MDPVPFGNHLHLFDARAGDQSSTSRKRFQSPPQSQSDAFEQTSLGHIGERMAIYDSTKIRREFQSASDLSEASEEDGDVRWGGRWRQILRVARIADNRVGCHST